MNLFVGAYDASEVGIFCMSVCMFYSLKVKNFTALKKLSFQQIGPAPNAKIFLHGKLRRLHFQGKINCR